MPIRIDPRKTQWESNKIATCKMNKIYCVFNLWQYDNTLYDYKIRRSIEKKEDQANFKEEYFWKSLFSYAKNWQKNL